MIGLHLKTSLSYIRRAPFQAIAAISILVLTFFVSTLIATLLYASNQILHEFETRPQIIAFLKKDVAEERGQELVESLRADARVREVKLVSKEEAVEIYKSATSDNPLLGELVSTSIFPSSVEFSTTDLAFAEELIEQVKKDDRVESVGFTASVGGEASLDEVLTRLRTITQYVRAGGVSVVSVLALTSFLVLMVVISMRIQTRKSEIETLSLIGATKGFIRMPIVFEALLYALCGTIIGWALGFMAVLYATPALLAYFGSIEVVPRASEQFFALFGLILLGEIIIGIIIALIGSVIAVSRALRG